MSYDVQISRVELCAVIELQGRQEAIASWVGADIPDFPTAPNTVTTRENLSLYWIAEQRWLLQAAIEDEDRLLSITRVETAPLEISIVLVSDTLKYFRITGADAEQVISIASSIDTDLSVFPENAVTYTEAFGIRALLLRCSGGFEIAVESSYADMIEDYLQRATS